MTHEELLAKIAEITDHAGELNGSESLESLNWDSLHTLSLIALGDEIGTTFTADALLGCRTTGDIINLIGVHKTL